MCNGHLDHFNHFRPFLSQKIYITNKYTLMCIAFLKFDNWLDSYILFKIVLLMMSVECILSYKIHCFLQALPSCVTPSTYNCYRVSLGIKQQPHVTVMCHGHRVQSYLTEHIYSCFDIIVKPRQRLSIFSDVLIRLIRRCWKYVSLVIIDLILNVNQV